MDYICDFCREEKSTVYCRSDAASLCLSCDRSVHSANALSQRHFRSLVCERCNSQPASVRRTEDRLSLCQDCDWEGHDGTRSHSRQAVNCYSGCPSSDEFSRIWPFLQDIPSVDNSACEKELDSMTISPNSLIKGKSEYDASSSCSRTTSIADQPLGMTKSTPSKLPTLCGIGEFDDFNMNEVNLSITNFEELFGLNNPHNLFHERTDCWFDFDYKTTTYPAEGSSIGICSNAASADSILSTKTEPNLCFVMRTHSDISFSGLSIESNAGGVGGGDHLECEASPMPRSTTRTSAVLRYKEKKKARKFDKRVRYASRKERADIRRRVKGRFVKASDVYDYDPLGPTKSF